MQTVSSPNERAEQARRETGRLFGSKAACSIPVWKSVGFASLNWAINSQAMNSSPNHARDVIFGNPSKLNLSD